MVYIATNTLFLKVVIYRSYCQEYGDRIDCRRDTWALRGRVAWALPLESAGIAARGSMGLAVSVRLTARDAWALQPRKYGTKSQGYMGLTA